MSFTCPLTLPKTAILDDAVAAARGFYNETPNLEWRDEKTDTHYFGWKNKTWFIASIYSVEFGSSKFWVYQAQTQMGFRDVAKFAKYAINGHRVFE